MQFAGNMGEVEVMGCLGGMGAGGGRASSRAKYRKLKHKLMFP